MNKNECKKYLKRAVRALINKNKSITVSNLEMEMQEVINSESKIYIAYSKIALHTLLRSATKITPNELATEIDTISKIYNINDILAKSKDL